MRAIVLGLMLLFSLSGFAKSNPAGASNQSVVIKSDDGVCHPPGSKRHKTKSKKKFTTFKSLDDCLKSGGKMRNVFPGHTV